MNFLSNPGWQTNPRRWNSFDGEGWKHWVPIKSFVQQIYTTKLRFGSKRVFPPYFFPFNFMARHGKCFLTKRLQLSFFRAKRLLTSLFFRNFLQAQGVDPPSRIFAKKIGGGGNFPLSEHQSRLGTGSRRRVFTEERKLWYTMKYFCFASILGCFYWYVVSHDFFVVDLLQILCIFILLFPHFPYFCHFPHQTSWSDSILSFFPQSPRGGGGVDSDRFGAFFQNRQNPQKPRWWDIQSWIEV